MEFSSETTSAVSKTIESLTKYASELVAHAEASPAAESVANTSFWGFIGRSLLFLMTIVPQTLLGIATFTTLTLPTWLFTLFSATLTVTMNATTLLLIALALLSTISWFVRYRFMNMYTRLPPEPQRKEPQIDLFPDSQEGDSKPGLANYLDEFLDAIKVFGYLERPVFHELTRTMQTRKLIAGETLLLEEEKGFCLVVDGIVQIFVKSLQERQRSANDELAGELFGDEEDQHLQGNLRYQLLTEVKNGAPMSSLFSILSLFTEDVKLRPETSGSSSSSFERPEHTPDSAPASPNGLESMATEFSSGKRGHKKHMPQVPPLNLADLHSPIASEHQSTRRNEGHRRPRAKSAHPDIVARALVDTTIAIIPASAFRRLTRTYPKATAHIVQVILTRLQRVTLSTAHQYLGLTTEVLHMEQLMNKYTSNDLPNHLRGDALVRLKEKFQKERDRIGPEEGKKGIALHKPPSSRRRSSSSMRKEAVLASRMAAARSGSLGLTPLRPSSETERQVSPGDLISNMQLPPRGPRLERMPTQMRSLSGLSASPSPVKSPMSEREKPLFRPGLESGVLHRQQSLDEDGVFRVAVLDCMIRSMGLALDMTEAFKRDNSGEQSPRLLSYDSKRQTAVFSNAFGFIDPYEGSGDADSESAMSTSIGSLAASLQGKNLNDELIDDIEIVFFPQGSVLVEQGERNPGVYFVIDGLLDVSVVVEDKNSGLHGRSNDFSGRRPNVSAQDLFPHLKRRRTKSPHNSSLPGKSNYHSRKSLFLIKPGGIAGYIGTISSYRSFTDVTAKTDVYVGFLPRTSLERFADRHPVVLLTMAKRLTSLLPRLILHIDFALEWVQISAGQVIYHQGDESDAIYIVLNGRLRAVREKEDGSILLSGEFGQGDSIGELEVMTETSRPATLHAIRDTELAKLPRTLFNSLAQEHPGITIQITKLIAQRMRALIDDPLVEKTPEHGHSAIAHSPSSALNLRTVAIVPVTAGVPVTEFGHRLLTALTQLGVPNGATSLTQAAILNVLGRHAFSRMGKLKLSQYLADLEEKFDMVVYIADTNVNAPWTQTCISQADSILLVGLAEASPNVGEYERFLLGMKTTARKELVLLHDERYCPPGRTRKWLKNRVWINGGHHHIQMPYRTASEATPHGHARRFGNALKQRVQVLQAEIQKYTSRRVRLTPSYSAETPYKGDFYRLARRLCGQSIGLVLGGGGARGIAQIGIIRALEEAGIPIDIIGGTSIGAFNGALYARDADVVPMYGRAKKFAGRMGSMWRFALDLTYPSASYTTGHEFNRGIFKTFGTSQIEDFWLQFYCNTTNISKSRLEIHTSGYIWRYVRASMSLAGLLPPLCDEGSMLLDGGYLDNLTVAHMKSLGAAVIFAIDVGSLDDPTPQAFGDSLSGFWALLNRWNPFSGFPNPPTLAEIQARLAYVSSHDALERAKKTPGCLYMRPPIDAYGTLDFAKFDEIYEVGYGYGREFLASIRAKGELKGVVGRWDESEEQKGLRRTMAPRRASI